MTIVISKGPDVVVTPDFRTMTVDQATAAAAAAGVQVQAQGVFSGGRRVRATTHADVSREGCLEAGERLARIVASAGRD